MAIGGLNRDQSKMSSDTSVEVHASPPFFLPPMDVPIGAVTVTTPDRIMLLCARYVCYKFDKTSGKWPKHSDLPDERLSSGAVSLTSGTYLLGGKAAARRTSLFLAKGSTTWVAGPDIPRGGFYFSCVVKWGSIKFVIVGSLKWDATQMTMYDEQTKAWTDFDSELAEPGLGKLACIRAEGPAVLVTGGTTPATGTTSVADAFGQHGTTKTFKLNRHGDVADAGNLQQRRQDHAMIELDGKVIVVGGRTGNLVIGSYGTIEQWDEVNNEWTRVLTGLMEGRYGHTLAIFP